MIDTIRQRLAAVLRKLADKLDARGGPGPVIR